MVRLFINLGRKDNIQVSDLVKFIASTSGIKGKEIGRVDMLDKFSFFEIPKNQLDDVMTSGSTLHRAYTLLKGHRYPIKIAVLALHDLLLVHKSKKCRKLRWKKLVNKQECDYTFNQEGGGFQ